MRKPDHIVEIVGIGVLGLFLAMGCKSRVATSPVENEPTPIEGAFRLVASLPSFGNSVALDADDNLYVVEKTRDVFDVNAINDERVVKYSPDWNRLFSVGQRKQAEATATTMTGTGPHNINITTGVNDTFIFSIDGAAPITVTLTAGSRTANQNANSINLAAGVTVAFSANVDGDSVIRLVSPTRGENSSILIGAGNANGPLGFADGQYITGLGVDVALGNFYLLADLAVDGCGNIFTVEQGWVRNYQSSLSYTWGNSRIQMFDSSGQYVKHFFADPTKATNISPKPVTGLNVPENQVFAQCKFLEVGFIDDGMGNMVQRAVMLSKGSDGNGSGGASALEVFDFAADPPVFASYKADGFIGDSWGMVWLPLEAGTVSVAPGAFFTMDNGGTVVRKHTLNTTGAYTGFAVQASPADQTASAAGAGPWGYVRDGFDPHSCGAAMGNGGQNFGMNITHYAVAQANTFPKVDIYEGDLSAINRWISSVGSKGFGPGEFNRPQSPRFDSRGNLYVQDPQKDRVHVFRPAGPL